ncbi:C163A protein, partial [Rostratula benghalensis]|nr:C163A protein [Rostratula benghalensis]
LRLVGGGGRCAGRVEVKHDGEWGSVCVYDFDWEARWAGVVCRQLGCGRVARASAYAPFGEATGRIWLQPFFCQGSEKELQDCPHFSWGQHFCSHNRDAGVTCTEAVELRLVAGGSPCAGRVEVKLQGRWGTVGDDDWNMKDAEVVCQQLGCGSAVGAYAAAFRFGRGDGPISLAVVNCQGHEATLWDCEIHGWGPYSGIHDFDTAVVCQGGSRATAGDTPVPARSLIADPCPPLPVGFTRLVGGPGACAGRLEVRRGQTWVGVCQDDVDIEAAQVVCRELGCGEALAFPVPGRFEAGAGPLWQGGFNCSGTEPLLSSCARHPPRGQGCSGHAAIVCSRKRLGTPRRVLEGPLHRAPHPNALFAAAYTGFRLAGNSSGCAGRVEVEAGGTWGSLCATGWDLPDAHVLCHHLGCGPSAPAVPPGGSFGGGDGPLRPHAFSCSGSERHPGQCPTAALGETPCPPGHAAAVNCTGPYGWEQALRGAFGTPQEGGAGNTGPFWAATPCRSPPCPAGSRRVRLAGGPGRCAGRVEVYLGGTWATVCQENWDLPDATVVCRQLGCGSALAAPGSHRYGPGAGPPWLDAGGCAGSEASLWDC